jgi:hypothetical protein
MTTSSPMLIAARRTSTVAAAAATLIAAERWLRGPMAVAVPMPRDPAQWREAIERRGPLYPAIAAMRMLAIGATWYLLALVVLGSAARLLRLTRTVQRLDRMSPAIMRRALGPLAVVGLALPAMPLARADSTAITVTVTPPVATMVLVDDDPGQPPPATMVLDDGPDAADNSVVGDGKPSSDSSTEVSSDADAGSTAAAGRPASGDHVVEVGESFWTIARDVLRPALGRDTTDHDIVPFWRRLIEANNDRLVEAGNPDLIRPGQRFIIPEVETGA